MLPLLQLVPSVRKQHKTQYAFKLVLCHIHTPRLTPLIIATFLFIRDETANYSTAVVFTVAWQSKGKGKENDCVSICSTASQSSGVEQVPLTSSTLCLLSSSYSPLGPSSSTAALFPVPPISKSKYSATASLSIMHQACIVG